MADKRQYLEVPIGEWKMGGRNTVLRATGVDAGIAVALHIPRLMIGWLGYFSQEQLGAIDNLLNEARRQMVSPREVLLWGGGLALPPFTTDNYRQELANTRRTQAIARDTFKRSGFTIRRILWGPREHILALTLDCETVRCYFDQERVEF
jgi:hypothetical protein